MCLIPQKQKTNRLMKWIPGQECGWFAPLITLDFNQLKDNQSLNKA